MNFCVIPSAFPQYYCYVLPPKPTQHGYVQLCEYRREDATLAEVPGPTRVLVTLLLLLVVRLS